MTDILLRGLPADQFAAAMATFGLYSVIDGCKIRFESPDRLRYYPVLTSRHYKTLDDLAATLATEETWTLLGLSGDRPELATTGLSSADFYTLYDDDADFASGLATDAVQKEAVEDEDGDAPKSQVDRVGRTPFYCLKRQAVISKELDLLIPSLTTQGVINTLSSERTWDWQFANQPFGLHPQFETGWVLRNPPETFSEIVVAKKGKVKVNKKEQPFNKKRVPILTLLFLASWRQFTVFPSRRDTSTAGFDGLDFYYPTFSNSLDADEFRALMVNPWLKEFRRYRKGFAAMGVSQVYKTTKSGLGVKNEPHFTTPLPL